MNVRAADISPSAGVHRWSKEAGTSAATELSSFSQNAAGQVAIRVLGLGVDAALQDSIGGEGHIGFVLGYFSASIYVLVNSFLKWEKLQIFDFVERKYSGNKRCASGEMVRGVQNMQRG